MGGVRWSDDGGVRRGDDGSGTGMAACGGVMMAAALAIEATRAVLWAACAG